jgi:ubiquinone biosynthesis protein UbiJ
MARGWTHRAASTTVQNIAEYLGHERQHLVPRNEGEQFLRGVDAVREDVDRLEARIALLAEKRGASQ